MEPVGIVGLGLIGLSLAKRLVAAGCVVHGYDIAPERNALLADLGGRPAESPAAVGAHCRAIFLSVLTTDQVESVVEGGGGQGGGPMGLTKDHVVIVVSTCDPDRIAAMATRNAGRARIVEFPISGNSDQIALGNGVGLAGGDRDAVESVAP